MKGMKRILITSGATLAFLILAGGTASAQEKKIEKKVHIVTIDDGKKTVIDTTYVITDTTDSKFDEFLKIEDGNFISHNKGGKGRTYYFSFPDMPDLEGMPDFQAMPDFPDSLMQKHMRNMMSILEEKGNIMYDLTIDGVTVHISAPEGKSKEAEQILSEAKKILNTK